MSRKKIKFVVAGYGYIGKRHAEMIGKNPDCELVAICDLRPPGNEASPAVLFFESVTDLLASGIDFDVASIATPNGLHKAHAIQLLNAGRHVLIEKPMALHKSDCEEIIATAARVNRLAFCVMQNRYSPVVHWLREIIEKQVLGKIYFVQTNCFWNRGGAYYTGSDWHGSAEKDGGTLFTQFSHFIDLLLLLFGDFSNIRARFKNFAHAGMMDFEDTGTVHFDLACGATGNLNYTTAVFEKNLESSICIIGEKGTVKIGGQYMDQLLLADMAGYVPPPLPATDPRNNHGLIIAGMADVLQGRREPVSNAADAMRVVETIERIYSAGKPV